MNDFTKEELQIILDWSGELGSEYGTKGTPEEQRLDRKISSMIDNYCEHEIRSKYGDCVECGHDNGVCCD